jgi:hypothetical protein
MFFFYSIAFDYNFVVNVKTGGFVSGPVEEIAVLFALLRDNRAGLAAHRPELGWPRNGNLAILRNTKLDEIKHFFRGISTEFREIPRKDFAKISHIFAKYFAEFRGILWYNF